MKKLLSLTLTLVCILTTLILTTLIGCNNASQQPTINAEIELCTEDLLVIKVTETTQNANALDLLAKLQSEDKVIFESFDGGYGAYVTSINGKGEIVNGNEGYSWMLYTSDEELSSTEFGSLNYNGETYGQAAVGASSLKVKAGEYYIWAYERWSY